MVLVLRHRRLLVKTVISVLMASLMNNSVAAWRSSLVDPKMVMGQVGVLRVKEGTTTSVASTSLGHPQSVMDPLAKVCPHLLPVSRWTLTIYL